MTTPSYVRAKSWHVLDRVNAAGWHTACGRLVNDAAPVSDTFPAGEKTCETCFRVLALEAEREDVTSEPEDAA